MTRLLLLRHGQSEGNLTERFLGHTDLALTPLGRAQAELASEYIAKLPVTAVYSSDLKRAFDTARASAGKLGLTIVPDRRLREIYAGVWENVRFDELPKLYPDEYRVWMTNIGMSRCNGGESVTELSERISAAIDDIAARNDGGTVLIATHATPIRTQCCRAAGLPPEKMCVIPWVSNASLTTFEWERGRLNAVEVSRDDYLGDRATALPTNV